MKEYAEKILVVDDQDSGQVMTLLQELALKVESEFEISVARDGKQALETVRNETFDLILTDLSMPVMTGVEFVEAARQEDLIHPSTKVVLMSWGFGSLEVELARRLFDILMPKERLYDDLAYYVKRKEVSVVK